MLDIRLTLIVSMALFAILCAFPFSAISEPFDCVKNRCGIALDAPYPNLVVGTVDSITTPDQTAILFEKAQNIGLWRVFPVDPKVFVSKIQPLSITFAPGRSITVLADFNEVHWTWMKVGQLIRFAPHRGLHEKPRPDDPYWVGIGCVALLCAPNDNQCRGNYRSGLYRLSDGHELDSQGRHTVAGGAVIDPMSMLLKKPGS